MYNEDLMMGIYFPKHVVIISNIINTKGYIGLCFYKIYLFVSKYCDMTQMKYYKHKKLLSCYFSYKFHGNIFSECHSNFPPKVSEIHKMEGNWVGGVDWIHMAQDRDRWWTLVNTIMNSSLNVFDDGVVLPR
jgi:hypothetical protein